jgi:hypothetical protein
LAGVLKDALSRLSDCRLGIDALLGLPKLKLGQVLAGITLPPECLHPLLRVPSCGVLNLAGGLELLIQEFLKGIKLLSGRLLTDPVGLNEPEQSGLLLLNLGDDTATGANLRPSRAFRDHGTASVRFRNLITTEFLFLQGFFAGREFKLNEPFALFNEGLESPLLSLAFCGCAKGFLSLGDNLPLEREAPFE